MALVLAVALPGCVDEDAVQAASFMPNVGVRPPPPPGLAERVVVEFEGRLTLSYYCQPVRHAAVERALYDQVAAEHGFDVPDGTRYLNVTLSWDAGAPDGSLEDLELEVYDPADKFRGGSWADQPERVDLELTSGEAGPWWARVYVCQSVPTDYVLTVEMS